MSFSASPSPESLPYNAFNRYLRRRYRGRVQKIPLDAGFGCPHRSGKDGTKGRDGLAISVATLS